MKQGWIYLKNKRVYLQNLPIPENKREWHTFDHEDGWKRLDRGDLVDSIIDNLKGTCKSLTEVCEDHNLEHTDELTLMELFRIDQDIFCCEICGWWFDASDEVCVDEIFQKCCHYCYEEQK